MASSIDYLDYVLDLLDDVPEVTSRKMMGEYLLYASGKLFGGIYDDRLLVKPVKAAITYMPDAAYELPYEGAKEMLLVDNVDDSEYLCKLVEAMESELPQKKKKK